MTTTPDLATYDYIAISSSAGKDSQAMLDYIVELARERGVLDRVVVIHADLGDVEWEGTSALAREQAEAYGVRFELVSRIGGQATRDGKAYASGEKFGDLLDYARRRGKWPDSGNRWCTSDFKRGPIQTVYTRLAREFRERTGERRACRILDCQGLRAEESPARAKKPQFAQRKATSAQHVETWLPILHWLEGDVWNRIERSGVRHHWAYDVGMPRLSCVFCIFAPKEALVLAGKHNPELLEKYVEAEAEMGHTFRQNLSLADVQRAVEEDQVVPLDRLTGAWNM